MKATDPGTRRGEENLRLLYREMAQAAGEQVQHFTGYSVFPGSTAIWQPLVFDPCLQQNDWDTMHGKMQEGQLPHILVTSPEKTEAAWLEIFSATAVEKGHWECMELQPADFTPVSPAFPIRLQVVTTLEMLSGWSRLAAANFGEAHLPDAALLHHLAQQPAFTFYLGETDGQPVFTAFTFRSRDCTGIYQVSVHPGFRRKGAGSAFLSHLIEQENATPAFILQSTPAACRLNQQLGFVRKGTMHYFIF